MIHPRPLYTPTPHNHRTIHLFQNWFPQPRISPNQSSSTALQNHTNSSEVSKPHAAILAREPRNLFDDGPRNEFAESESRKPHGQSCWIVLWITTAAMLLSVQHSFIEIAILSAHFLSGRLGFLLVCVFNVNSTHVITRIRS